jgi:hypothetical protein
MGEKKLRKAEGEEVEARPQPPIGTGHKEEERVDAVAVKDKLAGRPDDRNVRKDG